MAVLGGGPAGMAAASRGAELGARVVLFDEHAAPGGQVYRTPAPGLRVPASADSRAGDALRRRLAKSGAEVRSFQRVWALGGGPLVAEGEPATPFRIDAHDEGGVTLAEARALILCPGAYERVIPFEGWTVPGVFGLAAATILLKAQGVLPGARVVVAGSGPLLAAVAAGIIAKGGTVAAIIDAAPLADWWRAVPALARQPRLFARGAGWVGRAIAARTPVLSGYRVTRALGEDGVAAVEVTSREGGTTRGFACDALCVGHGLVPATEAARLYRASLSYCRERGGWTLAVDAAQRTTVPRLYAAGDGAGIEGAAAAPLAGEIAANTALADVGLLPEAAAMRANLKLRRARRRRARFGAAMAALMTPPADLLETIPPGCIVCRCEDVTRAEIDAAAALGARDLNQLKQFTRCGMGPCQGRMCGEAAAELLARHVGGGREAVGLWTAQVPLRPVPMSALLGAFEYGDIPVQTPAPI